MKRVIVDTSKFIDYSRTEKGVYLDLYELFVEGACELFIPTVVLTEFWAGKDMNRKSNIDRAEEIFSEIKRIDADEKITKLAGELIRKQFVLGFDAIIAATALSINAEIATKNIKHFKKVPKLKLFQP